MGVQEQASACSLHGLVPCPSGTAVYGPVRTLVWDPWLALAVSHGDPIQPPLFFPATANFGGFFASWRVANMPDFVTVRTVAKFHEAG